MSKMSLGILIGVAVVALILLFAFTSRDQGIESATQAAAINTKNISKSSAEEALASAVLEQDEGNQLQAEIDPYQDEAIKAQMLQVADLYQETSKYPHYSQPITDPDSVKEPEPFEETEVDLPYPTDEGGEPVRLSAAVDNYQYFQGDVITTRLQVSGAPADTFVQATATLSSGKGDTPLTVQLDAVDQSLSSFIGSFDTKLIASELLTTEMIVKIQVTVGEQNLFTTVAFRYSEAAAQLVAVPYVRQEQEFLLIPLQYSVFSAGYYFVNAVLEDAESGQPLVRLQAEGALAQGNGILTLKAHISALKLKGSEGPYVLRSIQTYRGAETGEAYDVPASNAQLRFDIQGFPFSQYEDVQHQDDLATERLEFLRNLGVGEEASQLSPPSPSSSEDL